MVSEKQTTTKTSPDEKFRLMRVQFMQLEKKRDRDMAARRELDLQLKVTKKHVKVLQAELKKCLTMKNEKALAAIAENDNLHKSLKAKKWENDIFRNQLLEIREERKKCDKCEKHRERAAVKDREISKTIARLNGEIRKWKKLAEATEVATELIEVQRELDEQKVLTEEGREWRRVALDMINLCKGGSTTRRGSMEIKTTGDVSENDKTSEADVKVQRRGSIIGNKSKRVTINDDDGDDKKRRKTRKGQNQGKDENKNKGEDENRNQGEDENKNKGKNENKNDEDEKESITTTPRKGEGESENDDKENDDHDHDHVSMSDEDAYLDEQFSEPECIS